MRCKVSSLIHLLDWRGHLQSKCPTTDFTFFSLFISIIGLSREWGVGVVLKEYPLDSNNINQFKYTVKQSYPQFYILSRTSIPNKFNPFLIVIETDFERVTLALVICFSSLTI